MKYFLLASRVLLGLIFFIIGLNSILHFFHRPPTGDALTWYSIMVAHGWMSFIGVVMVICGLLLLVGRFVALALVVLAPILVNILLYHALLWPHGYQLAIVATVLEIILLIAYHRSFTPLLLPEQRPVVPRV